MRCSNRLVFLAFLAIGTLISQRVAVADDYLGTAAQTPQKAQAPQNAPSPATNAPSPSPHTSSAPTNLLTTTPTQPVFTQSDNGECSTDHKWIFEAESVFLAPIMHQQFGNIEMVDNQGNVTQQSFTSNQPGFTASPRIAIGILGDNNWGLIGRYWELQSGCIAPSFDTMGGNGLSTASYFRAETADLEVTRLFGRGSDDGQLRLSFGVRYADLSEAGGLGVDATNTLGGIYQSEVFSNHEFGGVGLTMGLQGLRPVGCKGFNLFFDARASILWDANAGNSVVTRAGYFDNTSYAYAANSGASEDTANLFIGEIRVGGQWDAPLKCIPANAFFRVAFEYQYWCTGSSGGAEATSFAGPIGGPTIVSTGASNGNAHVDLVGFTLGTGLTW